MIPMESTLNKAQITFENWKKIPLQNKTEISRKLAQLLENQKEELATLISLEMHKPISQSIAEIEKCAWLCRYYAENASLFLQPSIRESFAKKSNVTFEPLGVILGIMPWNFPFWQVFRFAVPTLLAGNTVVVKHASNVPKCAAIIEKVFLQAGFFAGCYSNLELHSSKIHLVISNPIIKAISLTGSEQAGKSVAEIAGKNLKKCVLELGGNNALIILPDADLETVIPIALMARMQNNGQSCIAAKRFLIHKDIENEFISKFKIAISQLIIGNTLEKATQICQLAREDLAIELEQQVQKSIQLGAKLVCGGKRDHLFYEPTILNNVQPNMPVFFEETFGPVVSITTFSSLEEAIEISNNSKYGLGVSIFTQNVNAILPYISHFNEGAVFINEMVKSDPRLPFGGIKLSGYGRELAEEGIKEFVNSKTVVIQ